jgi:glycosyltransferase involved in cell wall biosynthesis
MKILIIEPYLSGSHAAWAKEYAEHSSHEVGILGLEGRHWKWRMHGGAVTLARLFAEGAYEPDVMVATDMLDLTVFLALTKEMTADIPTAVYFHENQITYPWSEKDRDLAKERDVHYCFINYSSALAADSVLFNSEYHRNAFLDSLEPFLHAFPDHHEPETVEAIRRRSSVLPLGLDLRSLDGYRVDRDPAQRPLLVWNHRWEYDKNPDEFFRAVTALERQGLDFDLAVLGESFDVEPAVFRETARRLGDRVVQLGYVDSLADYAAWLWRADILPVTSVHDFFGASVVQAIYCNCYPLLPRRLAYPEHIPADRHPDHLYDNFGDLVTMLGDRIEQILHTRGTETRSFVTRYDWETMAPAYDRVFEAIAADAQPQNNPRI